MLTLALGSCAQTDAPPGRGSPFPSFALIQPDGTSIVSSAFAQRPLLVNFWATWCPPCREEMADLEQLYRQLGPKGMAMLAVSVDTDRLLVVEFLRARGLSFTVALDSDGQLSSKTLRVPGFPSTYLVGRDGVINDVLVGPRPWASAEWQRRIATQLALT